MTTDYRYIFLTLRTEEVIAEIDLFGVYFERNISDPGQFNGSFQLDQSGKSNEELMSATIPGRTWLVVERNGVPVWWGIVWSRTYQSQAKICQLYAWGFESYPRRQKILTNFSRFSTPNTQIFADLWNDMIMVEGRNLNIDIPSISDGPLKDLSVLASDNVYYADVMDALADSSDGFDWTIDCTRNNFGGYTKTLRIGYPTLGKTSASPDILVFEYPGNILNYYCSESMPNAATNVFAIGQGEGDTMPKAEASNASLINTYGWPRWDIDVSYKDVSEPELIAALAQQQALVRKPPMPTYTITIKGNINPVVGSYGLGDACKLVMTDPRHPMPMTGEPGLDIPSRVIGYEVHPSSSDGTEEVNVHLPGDTENG